MSLLLAVIPAIDPLRLAASRVRTWLAKRRVGTAEKRLEKLKNLRAQLRDFNGDRVKLNGYLLSRLLVGLMLWVLQSIVGNGFDLINSGAMSFTVFTDPKQIRPMAQSDFANMSVKVGIALGTLELVVFAALLIWSLFAMRRGVAIWRSVSDFETTEAALTSEIADLEHFIATGERSRPPEQLQSEHEAA